MSDGGVTQFHRYERHLPHWQRPGATFFLTFTLRDRRVCDLTRKDIAPLIIDALFFLHENRYLLSDYTVMPDHVHVLLKPLRGEDGWFPLAKITHSIKSWTANRINAIVRRRGQLWEEETFDHIVRNIGKLRQIKHYIWMNPVKKGLVERPELWPWWGHGSHRCTLTETGEDRGTDEGNDNEND